MNRDEKAAVIDQLAEDLDAAQAVFAVDYRGISVPQAAELRAKLREGDAKFKVVKNRLAKRAAEKAGAAELDELLNGPIALALINGDPVVVAKAITDFTREHEILEYKGGIMEGSALDADAFKAIAKLPGRDVLHGQLVGLAASPLTGLVAAMNNLISGLGRQLAQIAEQGLVSGEAPAAEAPEPEAPVEEPAPEEAPVEEPPAEEEAPEPEAEEAAAEEEAEEAPEAEAEAAEEAPEAEAETSDEAEKTDEETQED